jgi:nitroreductase
MTSGKEMLELIAGRQSDRKYLDIPVEREKIERILEAGRISPSACNAQPWKFIVVDKAELKTKIAKAAAAKLIGMNVFINQAAYAYSNSKGEAKLFIKGWCNN